MTQPPPTAPFFGALLRGSLALWLWALYFAFVYVGVAVGCRAGWQQASLPGGASPLRALLLVGSGLAVAAALLLVVRSLRRPTTGGDDLLPRVERIAAGLALIAIAWTAVPAMLLPLCQP